METTYKHYIRLNDNEDIIKGFSTAFEQSQEGDILINESENLHFRLFPDDEENPLLQNEYGVFLYRYVNGGIVAKTNEEMEAGRKVLEVSPQFQITILNEKIQNALPYVVMNIVTMLGSTPHVIDNELDSRSVMQLNTTMDDNSMDTFTQFIKILKERDALLTMIRG